MSGTNILTPSTSASRPRTPRTVSGILWNDANADGVIDGGEARLAGVTLDVLSGTDRRGHGDDRRHRRLLGRRPGSDIVYTVRVTDTGGALTGYAPNYERTEGTPARSTTRSRSTSPPATSRTSTSATPGRCRPTRRSPT